jgi:Protein of unknown function (DUF1203)
MTDYRITGLGPEPFIELYGLDDAELAARGAKRYVVDETPGFPDRIEMRDLAPGEHAILVNYTHQPANTPYRSSHAIFVREGATQRYDRVNQVPAVMKRRPLSLRAFDDAGMMIDADLAAGDEIEPLIQRFFSNPNVAYIHAHNAKRGCYSGRIDRVR